MIPYGKQLIDEDDINAVTSVLRGDWLTCGPIVDKFEEHFAKAVNARHAISCSNGTTALHLALLALDLGSGDTIVVPAITFLASANAARYVGANVVFADVDSNTGLMTAKTLEESILNNKNKNLKAVINVHLGGQCEDLESIYTIARKYNLLIIEDAAHAVGSIYIDQHGVRHTVGANDFSDITTFSFHPVKTIAMGEGGAITTNYQHIAQRMRALRSHGMIRDALAWEYTDNTGPWYYEMPEIGYNYRISDINCALGLSQLSKLQQFKNQRSRIVEVYDSKFSEVSFVKTVHKIKNSDTAWHLYVVHMDLNHLELTRSDVMIKLKNKGIGTQVHYIPLYKQPYYRKLYGEYSLPGAEKYYESCLSLPLYAGLSDIQQTQVINGVLEL